jgi:hypothetical protein
MKKEEIIEQFTKMSKEIEGIRWLLFLTKRYKRFVSYCLGITHEYLLERNYSLIQRARILKKVVKILTSKREEILKIVQEATEEDFLEHQKLFRESLKIINSNTPQLSEELVENILRSGALFISRGLERKTKIGKEKINKWMEKKLRKCIEELSDLHRVAEMIEKFEKEKGEKAKKERRKISGIITPIKEQSS